MRLATYNVKDLFEADGDSATKQLDAKLDFLAKKIQEVDVDVLALEEVGSEKGLAALLDRVPPKDGRSYAYRVFGTADARGIACAVASRLPITASRVHTAARLDFPAFGVGDPAPFGDRIPLRRGIVHAEIDASSLLGREFATVHVFAAHFKSRRAVPLRTKSGTPIEPTTARARREGELRSLVWRSMEALFVRGLVDEVTVANSEAHVVVAGDLNDVPDSIVVRIVEGGGEGSLRGAASLVPHAQRFSVLHRGRPNQIDHILLSPGLFARATAAGFHTHGLRDHGPAEAETITVDSDHAPHWVEFA